MSIAPVFFCAYSLCTTAVFISMAIVVQVYDKKLTNGLMISSELLTQVSYDWQSQPFVDAIVVSSPTTACPADYPDYVMERIFFGSGVGCNCLGVYSEDVYGSNLFNVDTICDYN